MSEAYLGEIEKFDVFQIEIKIAGIHFRDIQKGIDHLGHVVDLRDDLISYCGALVLTDEIPVLHIRLGDRERSLKFVCKTSRKVLCSCFEVLPVNVHSAHHEDRESLKDNKHDEEQDINIHVIMDYC